MMVRLGKLALAVLIAFGAAGAMDVPMTPSTAFAQATETATPTSTAVTITSTSVPEGWVGAGYFTSLTATGGAAPYAWSVTSGTLPAGLSLNTFGSLSGTPTTTGTFYFTARVQDNAGRSATLQLTMIVLSTTFVSTTALPNGQLGVAYSYTLAATGGTPPLLWTVSSGALPPGLTLSSSGVLAGTPISAGTSNFTVHVTDSAGAQATQALALVVGSMVVVDTTALPSGRVDTPYTATLSASGGVAAYTWTLTSGALPAGLTLSSSGTVSGTPVSAGAAAFTVQTTDAQGASATRAMTMTVTPSTGTISSGNIPPAGFGIIVFSGGTVSELVAASSCTQQTLAFWATIDGQFVGYVPNTTIGAVNAQFLGVFPGGVIPTNTPLVARC